jgi:hypothetical protein
MTGRSTWTAALAIGLCLLPLASSRGQEEPTDPAVTVDPIRGLVAPIALYPDPLLAAVLQASLFPIDVVQADRFLERYAEDQTLEPSPDWDPALVALLNYPSVIDEMNTHLDWTEAMGDAVYDQLEAVQFAIQDLRMAAYSMGMLTTNDMQAVVVDEGIVAIRPTSPDQIAIPDYDGFALLEALETVPATASTAPVPADTAAVAEAEPAEEPAAVEAAPAEPLPTEPVAEEPMAATTPVDAYAYAAAPAPTYATAPVYAAPRHRSRTHSRPAPSGAPPPRSQAGLSLVASSAMRSPTTTTMISTSTGTMPIGTVAAETSISRTAISSSVAAATSSAAIAPTSPPTSGSAATKPRWRRGASASARASPSPPCRRAAAPSCAASGATRWRCRHAGARRPPASSARRGKSSRRCGHRSSSAGRWPMSSGRARPDARPTAVV